MQLERKKENEGVSGFRTMIFLTLKQIINSINFCISFWNKVVNIFFM